MVKNKNATACKFYFRIGRLKYFWRLINGRARCVLGWARSTFGNFFRHSLHPKFSYKLYRITSTATLNIVTFYGKTKEKTPNYYNAQEVTIVLLCSLGMCLLMYWFLMRTKICWWDKISLHRNEGFCNVEKVSAAEFEMNRYRFELTFYSTLINEFSKTICIH